MTFRALLRGSAQNTPPTRIWGKRAGGANLGLHERLRREPGHVPDAAEGAEEPDAQPDVDGGGAWNECVT